MKLLLENWRKYLTEAVGVQDMEYIADRIKDVQLNNNLGEGEYDLDDFLGYFPEDDQVTLMMIGGLEVPYAPETPLGDLAKYNLQVKGLEEVEGYLIKNGRDFFTITVRENRAKITF